MALPLRSSTAAQPAAARSAPLPAIQISRRPALYADVLEPRPIVEPARRSLSPGLRRALEGAFILVVLGSIVAVWLEALR